MIKNNKYWIALGVVGWLAACEPSEAPRQAETVAKPETTSLKIKGLQLNNGEKWPANPETTDGIRQMQKILADYMQTGGENSSRQQLVDTLNAVKKQIFAQCTMKGEAHNNLHAYLVPLINKINDLKTVKTTEEEKQAIARLNEHLALYDNYFW